MLSNADGANSPNFSEMGEAVMEMEEENWVGIKWLKKERYGSISMSLGYSDFVDDYKTSIFEPNTPAVTHIAPINSSGLSVSLLAPQLCVRKDNKKKGLFVDGVCYLWDLQWQI